MGVGGNREGKGGWVKFEREGGGGGAGGGGGGGGEGGGGGGGGVFIK